jgi:ABC-type histidine transport system ATPase subunit
MISATGIELRAGARILLSDINLRVQPGDRIGLVGRNGAGKTTTLKVMAGEGQPFAGQVERRGSVGYLPQDPRTGDLHVTARDRVLSARGLDSLLTEMAKLEVELQNGGDDRLIRRYGAVEERFAALGGYAAEAESARICANLGLPDRVLAQRLGTLSGGQRRRIELARILFADAAETGGGTLLLTSPPTTSTPTPSAGCAGSSPATRAVSWSSATTPGCWRPSSTRSGTSTPTGPPSTSTTSAGAPTWSSARPTSGGAAASGPTPSARRAR